MFVPSTTTFHDLDSLRLVYQRVLSATNGSPTSATADRAGKRLCNRCLPGDTRQSRPLSGTNAAEASGTPEPEKAGGMPPRTEDDGRDRLRAGLARHR